MRSCVKKVTDARHRMTFQMFRLDLKSEEVCFFHICTTIMAPPWVVTSIKFVFFCGLHICVVWLQFALLACLNCVWRSLLAHWEPQLPWVLNESQLGAMAVNVQLLTSNSLLLRPLGFRNLCSGSSFLLSHLKTFCSGWDDSIVTILTPKYQHLIENFVQYLIENLCAILD